MGTTVVDGGEAVSQGEDGDGVSASGDDSATAGPYLFYRSGVEAGVRRSWSSDTSLRTVEDVITLSG